LRKHAYYLASIFRLMAGFSDWPLLLRLFLAGKAPGVFQVHLRSCGARFRVRGAMDVWSLKETFLDRFYERRIFVLQDGWGVIDIGAGIGDFSLFAALGRPNCLVHAYEPYAESFRLLEENLAMNKAGNITAFCQAVGAKSGSLMLDLTGGEPLQLRSLEPGRDRLPEKTRLVPVISLAEALARLERPCHMLKLDCEGAEFDILLQAPEEALRKVQRIALEYHDSLTPYRHADLERFLREAGFEVRIYPNHVHADLGYLYAWRPD